MKRTLFLVLLSLIAVTSNAQVPNPSFEDWDSLAVVNGQKIFNPINWLSSNASVITLGKGQPVQMTTDAHSGQYALKLVSMIDDEESQGAYIASGNDIGDGPMDNVEKFALKGRINGFEGYYKYAPNGNDSFSVFLALYLRGTYIGQAFMIKSTPSLTYTKFTWPIIFPSTIEAPDSAKFIITPSVNDDSEGSVLYLDDITVTYSSTTGINNTQKEIQSIRVYPNPATDHIALFGYNPKKHYYYKMHSVTGKLVQSGEIINGNIPIEENNNGLYIIDLEDENGEHSIQKIMKQ